MRIEQTTKCFEPLHNLRARLARRKTSLSPLPNNLLMTFQGYELPQHLF